MLRSGSGKAGLNSRNYNGFPADDYILYAQVILQHFLTAFIVFIKECVSIIVLYRECYGELGRSCLSDAPLGFQTSKCLLQNSFQHTETFPITSFQRRNSWYLAECEFKFNTAFIRNWMNNLQSGSSTRTKNTITTIIRLCNY